MERAPVQVAARARCGRARRRPSRPGRRSCSPRSSADERHPLGHQSAHALDRLEEVVRAVDLVHLARLRVADDDRPAGTRARARTAARARSARTRTWSVVGRGQSLPLVEHLLLEDAPVGAGDRDRGDVVEAVRLQRSRQFDRVRRAADVDRRVALRRRGHVVDRREVKEVPDLAPQLVRPGPSPRPEAAGADRRSPAVSASRPQTPATSRQRSIRSSSRSSRGLAHEHVDLSLARLQQPLDEAASDEACRPCDEICHRSLTRI